MIYLACFGGGFLAGTWAGILILALMEAARKDDDWRDENDDRY